MSLTDLASIIDNNSHVVVLFTAPSWCVPCQRFKPHWERAVKEAEDWTFVTVDIDDEPVLASEHNIASVPTVKVFRHGEYDRDIMAPQGAKPFLNDLRG